MGLILAADDLRPGMYVSILSWETDGSWRTSEYPRERRNEVSAVAALWRSLNSGLGNVDCPSQTPIPPGIPLRVLAISLPFVACVVLETDGSEVGITIIDFRMAKMCKLKRQFIDAIKRYVSERKTDEPDVHPESQEHSDFNA